MADAPKIDPLAISIVTAAFRALDGLKATAASLDTQTFRGFEHVVADGGPGNGMDDGTADWLAAREKSAPTPTRWISEPDTGIADAMNKGVALARGEWVLVLHAEDTLADPESLARALPHLGPDAPDIVGFDVLFTRSAGSRRLSSAGFVPKLAFKTTFAHQGAFCRRSLFQRIGGFDTGFRIAMDYEFFRRAGRAGAGFVRVPEVLAHMPDTGVSSRLDWPSLAARFAEERRVHVRHCPGPTMRGVYAAYWPAYLAYRRMRALF